MSKEDIDTNKIVGNEGTKAIPKMINPAIISAFGCWLICPVISLPTFDLSSVDTLVVIIPAVKDTINDGS